MAQRSTWKGALSFGLVAIPCKLYAGTEDKRKETTLTSLHAECGHQVKMPKYCPQCNKHFSAEMGNLDELSKAYKISDEQFIPISEEELAALPLSTLKSINVQHFIPNSTLWLEDPRWYKDVYFLRPDGEIGKKAFVLFMEAMNELEISGIAKITMRQREHLVIVSPWEGTLMLETLHWADEIREYEEHKVSATITAEELAMAKSLLTAMTKTVKPAEYTDEYRRALTEVINAKIEGKEVPVAPVAKQDANLIDALMASLKAVEPVAVPVP